MFFMTWIVDRLNYISSLFYELYIDSLYAGWPLEILADWFLSISNYFADLALDFSDFGSWVNSVTDQIAGFLNWTNIWSNLISWVPNIEALNTWFYTWWDNVLTVVNTWWTSTMEEVQGWIDAVRNYALALYDNLLATVNYLSETWDNFWTITWPALVADLGGLRSSWESFLSTTLPDLATWAGVGSIVESTIQNYFPFYDELVSLWGGILEMFTDPEDYLIKKLETALERFW